MKTIVRCFLLIGLSALCAGPVSAATLQARLIRAYNDKPAKEEHLKDIQAELKKKFGYQHYHLLGLQKAVLEDNKAQRLELPEGFVLTITGQGTQKHKHLVAIEWYSGKTLLVRSSIKIAPQGRLFIKGPDVASSTIILAISLSK